MKKTNLRVAAVATAAFVALSATANSRTAIFIGYQDANSIDNFQEEAACKMFKELHPDGSVITPADVNKITAADFDCVWVHIDRCAIGSGWNNLPEAFRSEAVVNALKAYLEEGGNLLLTKQATQLLVPLGRIEAGFAPGIFGDGVGAVGTDVWTVQTQIGYLWSVETAPEYDLTQYYDQRKHPIFENMRTMDFTGNGGFTYETYPLLGSGDGTELHREDHNCMWDLNAYGNIYKAEGKNVVEKFQKDNDALVLGQWGQIIDHAVAGIVEFLPKTTVTTRANGNSGRIIANGLAAYELSPRSGKNAFADNIRQLTANSINYLVTNGATSVIETIEMEENAPREYFNLQGISVNEENLVPGIYVVRQGKKVTKVVVK